MDHLHLLLSDGHIGILGQVDQRSASGGQWSAAAFQSFSLGAIRDGILLLDDNLVGEAGRGGREVQLLFETSSQLLFEPVQRTEE